MRFAEIALLALPFVVFALWRVLAPGRKPPRPLVLGMVGGVILMGALLLLLRQQDAAPRDAAYIPSHIENGRVIPGHAERTPPSPDRP